MGGVGSGSKPKQYDPTLVDLVRRLYESGHTQDEIAKWTGQTQKVIWNLMRRHGIAARVAAKRDQRGERNHAWKGDDALYQAMHLRVESERGKPSECAACGTTIAKRFEWANLTGHYDDTHDYVRLCVPCHRRFDRRRRGGDATCR